MKFITGFAVEIDVHEQADGGLIMRLSRDAAGLTAEDREGFAEVVRGRASTDLRQNVSAFHAATGIVDLTWPGVPTDDVVRLRAKMLVEELFETLRAMFDSSFSDIEADLYHDLANRTVRVSLPEYADGLADLMYIAEGGFLAFGIDSRPVHAEVQRANMAKVGGPVREDGKRIKPPGWTPPDIAGVIHRQTLGDCTFCGRKAVPVRAVGDATVCADPVRQPDKPMPPNCAWRYCARATNGAHNPDETGMCKDCGRDALLDAYQEALDGTAYMRQKVEEDPDHRAANIIYKDFLELAYRLRGILVRRDRA